jgi:hypothetical protein
MGHNFSFLFSVYERMVERLFFFYKKGKEGSHSIEHTYHCNIYSAQFFSTILYWAPMKGELKLIRDRNWID